eukprot:101596-Prorocentrum_minimum.AAC.1
MPAVSTNQSVDASQTTRRWFIEPLAISELTSWHWELRLNSQICALPIVGLGDAYTRAGFPLIGPQQVMPSGGFIQTDRSQIITDIQAGLHAAVREWARDNGSAILVVGDIVPLMFAFWAAEGVPYAFVGCAKSEYYARDPACNNANSRPWVERLLSPNCVYFPWERALLAPARCRLVAPRDPLTAAALMRALPLEARSKVRLSRIHI